MKHLLLKDGTLKEFRRMEMMGIINVTPDSFYEGSRAGSIDEALAKAEQMIREGAAFIDVGGESTRPGAAPVDVPEEISRVCPVIGEIKRRHREVLVSVDTYHAVTAESAIEAGADIINDISGLTFDAAMGHVAAKYRTPVILMHTGGRPEDMQKDPRYEDVVQEVYDFLAAQIEYAVNCGVARESLMIDLGIGFGKTYEHNMALLANIDKFAALGVPHLMAVSRKSFIGKALEEDDPADRLFGTVALSVYGAEHGIAAARVHDVKANLDAVRMWETLRDIPCQIGRASEAEAREEAEGGRR